MHGNASSRAAQERLRPVAMVVLFFALAGASCGRWAPDRLNERLLHAVDVCDGHAVQQLLNEGANPNTRDREGWTVLSLAAFRHDTNTIQLLLGRGANVNDLDASGWSALINGLGSDDVTRMLIEAGADVNQRHLKQGWTPLMAMAVAGRTNAIVLALKVGADATATNRDGKTAFDVAIENGKTNAANLILSSMARPSTNAPAAPPPKP